ncbi:MAG: hypothetical protein PHX21_13070 [bacterium]|nr:hypothetical protein [bacterium]
MKDIIQTIIVFSFLLSFIWWLIVGYGVMYEWKGFTDKVEDVSTLIWYAQTFGLGWVLSEDLWCRKRGE